MKTPNRHRVLHLLATAGLAMALGASDMAQAATQTPTLTVSTSIPTSCTTATVTNVTFGSPATLAVAADNTASGTLQITCTVGGTYTVIADNGSNYSGSSRRMRKGVSTAYLTYGLFTDASRVNAFPTTTGAATVISGTGNPVTTTLYAVLNAQSATEAGSYTDSVQLTVTY